jgi:hypothetical protein
MYGNWNIDTWEIDTSGKTDTSYRNLLKELNMRKEWTAQLAAVESELEQECYVRGWRLYAVVRNIM